MPSYSGKHRYLDPAGAPLAEGVCRLSFEDETLTLTPAQGAALECDLADIDAFSPGEYELSLKLYTGRTMLLRHFAKDFQNLCRTLLEAWRARTIKCLLLEDLREIARFDGSAQLDGADGSFSGRAEIRLFGSNLAVLPENALAFSWRYADIDSLDFDDATYTLGLRSGQDRLILTRLAKRTRELTDRLQEGMMNVAEKSASRVHELFPFLNPDQAQRVAGLMREGRAVAVSKLDSIHPKVEGALIGNTVDAKLRPYFDQLKAMAAEDGYFGGFKFIRPEAVEEEDEESDEDTGPDSGGTVAEETGTEAQGVEEKADSVLHFFFFVLKTAASGGAPGIAAWEATTHGGRATYFFRLPAQTSTDEAVARLNRAIVLLNFRREPIYLPDDSLESQPRYRRYAIACRKIPALRQLRSSFLGRATHTSPETWANQVQSILSRK